MQSRLEEVRYTGSSRVACFTVISPEFLPGCRDGFEPQEDLKLLLGQRKLALQKQVLFRVEGEQRLGYGCDGALVHAFAPHVLNHQPSSRHS